LLVVNILVLVYVGLPVLAPVLMKANLESPPAVIYKVYSGLCHQLAYRSWFLFGEQPVYPRAAAGVEGYKTFHEATGLDVDVIGDAATTGYIQGAIRSGNRAANAL
jgi:hypothetical protein